MDEIIKKDSPIPLWSNATLLLNDIKTLHPKHLTFEINIKLLRIFLEDKDQSPANKIFYQFSLNECYQKKQYMQWKLGIFIAYTPFCTGTIRLPSCILA